MTDWKYGGGMDFGLCIGWTGHIDVWGEMRNKKCKFIRFDFLILSC